MKTTLKTLTFFTALAFSQAAVSQTSLPLGNREFCGTAAPDQRWEEEFSKLVQEIVQQQGAAKQQQAAVYTIPVIMHVVHSGQSVGTYPNLAQGQLVSQIQALNNDYGGIGYNNWTYPSAAYVSWAVSQSLPNAKVDALGRVKIANCNIEFCLATQDTLGNILPEPGIDRINRVTKGWTSDPAGFSTVNSFRTYMDNTIKPGSIWNVRKYLNIWVTDINIGATGLLGYATFPPLTTLSGLPSPYGTATTDGFWCYARAFGSINYYASGNYYNGYDKGRTSTHEIGHWLGLRHIWGDGTCATDYCADTPPASASNFGTPNYPYKSGTCSGNSPNGEMFMNFMDYTDDNAKFMFTTDQATRISTAMSNSPYRKFLGTHNLCSVAAVATTATFNIAPTACGSAVVTLSNMTSGTPLPSYTWSAAGPGSVTFNPNNNSALNATFSTPGTYTLTLLASNGNTSTLSKVITIGTNPPLLISIPSQTVCLDDMINLTASGGNSYAWQPGSQVGAAVSYPAVASQVYTCIATGAGNCKTTSTINIEVTECTGLSKLSGTQSFFHVFPNPAKDLLHIKAFDNAGTEASLQVIDALGNVVIEQSCSFKKDNAGQINISGLSQGVYIIRLSTADGKQQSLRMIKN